MECVGGETNLFQSTKNKKRYKLYDRFIGVSSNIRNRSVSRYHIVSPVEQQKYSLPVVKYARDLLR